MTKLLMAPVRKKPQVKILYIPNGEYLTWPIWFKFGVGHFYVERYKEKRIKALAAGFTRYSTVERFHKYLDKTLPLNHVFGVEEFELIYISGD